MKKLIQNYIIWCAKRKIRHTKAKIIAITGSVGKSTTKEAVTAILKPHYKVRSNYGSLNNELGLPLAILGEKSATNIFSWLWKIIRITRRTFIYDSKIEIYVLECGIDKPGDMDEILKIITPDVSIITCVESVHRENFANFEQLISEKWKLAHGTKPQGTIIANYDNEPTLTQTKLVKDQRLFTFGFNGKADFCAHDIAYDLAGTQFTVKSTNNDQPFFVSLLGKAAVYSALPAVIVGNMFGIPANDVGQSLRELKPLPGRLSVIPGIRGCTLLEGSYNASPAAMKMSLEVLRTLPARRKIAIAGDMRELGDITEEAHQEMLNQLGNVCNLVITFGPYYGAAMQKLPSQKRSQAAFQHFDNREELIKFIVPKVGPGDIVLIKGSQNTIMLEKVSIKLMADPTQASKLLPRQYGSWLKM